MSTATEKPRVEWTLTDKNEIVRTEGGNALVVARLDAGLCQLADPDFGRFVAPIAKLLKAQGIESKIVSYQPPVMRDARLISDVAVGGEDEPTTTTGMQAPVEPTIPDEGVDGMRNLTVDQRKAVNLLRSKEGFPIGELERPVPPAPRLDSGAGDKTPAFVTWLLRYHPAKFVETYGVQRVGAIEVRVPGEMDPVTRMRKPTTRKMEPGHVIARRATIYTDVVRSGQMGDGEGGEA